jgi:DnaJ-class molecular chaperone
MADYYKTLGVPRNATQDQIRKAYKKIARENHPDAKPGDNAAAERFKQASEAYEVLGDAEKRKQYDQFGDAFKYAKAGGGKGGGPFPGGGFGGAGPIDLGDLFGGQLDLEDILGGALGGGRGRARARGGRAAARQGQDLQTEMQIPFQMAATGGTYDLSVQRNGKVDRISVKVPPGVHEGSVIRLAGEGEPGSGGGRAGDILITVHVAPHPYFRREGNDVLLDLPVTVGEAALGAKIDVPTLAEGNVSLRVPPGTSSGVKLRLKGKGFPDPKTKTPGDQFVVVKIVLPKEVSERAKKLLEELETAAPYSPRVGLW